mmetsp:Transcript_9737/g.9819  ORF Transcript_9737/g.9819 Transcript_9737/m.9819 type:complete len:334 (+) Transcript_9737:111-1112(+)|eukprot:CAMPEP_0182429652 /NCGR_PEP_ID=MMETSP1167-20130531/32020_1 /TAXON_ID=2988 /ORGANISM="Mallomonas Sp, Strain CCMP3275" /LENGTH=333 /DNA_ID=CAMNT_0024613651 /DNA_START=19 /DNA_END=1020 /DNA_ORIENTATION=-
MNSEITKERKHLVAKIQIGSAKGAITYNPNQTVFHPDDINEEKRRRKSEIKEYLQSKILNSDKRPWTDSVAVDNKACIRTNYQNFDHDRSNAYQYNYRAEVLPNKNIPKIDKSTKFHLSAMDPETISRLEEEREKDPIAQGKFHRTSEMPTHPNLVNKTKWNASTELLKNEREARLKSLVDKSASNSMKKKKDIKKSGRYISPIQRSEQFSDEVRRQKKSNSFSVEYHVFQEPPPPVNRNELKNRYAIEASRKFITTKHSGKWDFNKAEGRYMWSDTGSTVYDSPGDIKIVHNPDAYNMTGPTLASTSCGAPRRISKLVEENRRERERSVEFK